jgi:hypothetical protein
MGRISRYTGSAVNVKNLNNMGILASRGDVPGVGVIRKFGARTVDTDYDDIWEGTADTIPVPVTALTMNIRSGGDAADDDEGLGAREITLQGLDENYDHVTETLATNGAGESLATTTTFRRVFRAWVSAVGATGVANTGNIIIEDSANVERMYIGAGSGQSLFGHYTVPRRKVLFIEAIIVAVETARTGSLRIYKRENLDSVAAPFTNTQRLQIEMAGFSDQITYQFAVPIKITGPADVWCQGLVDTGTGYFTTEFDGFEIDVDGYRELAGSRTNE